MIPVLIFDAVVVICFCALAYLFHHWWIALFAYLFILTYKNHVDDKDDKDGDEK